MITFQNLDIDQENKEALSKYCAGKYFEMDLTKREFVLINPNLYAVKGENGFGTCGVIMKIKGEFLFFDIEEMHGLNSNLQDYYRD